VTCILKKKAYELFFGYSSEEATTETIGCVNDRSDAYYSDEETDWAADDRETARKWSQDRKYWKKCDQVNKHWEKVIAKRTADVKLEEAKRSELRYKMLSNLLNEKDEAEAYVSSTVLRFLITWQEATRDEKAMESKVATTYWHKNGYFGMGYD
jgi:hypothetical protein